MRGKDDEGRLKLRHVGITPAYAGKSLSLWAEFGSRVGSPPRMRGKAGYWVKDAQGRGITPAYAGKRGYFEFISISR